MTFLVYSEPIDILYQMWEWNFIDQKKKKKKKQIWFN